MKKDRFFDAKLVITLLSIIIVTALVIAGMYYGSLYAMEARYQNNLKNGYACIEQGKYEDAIKLLEDAYKYEPSEEAAVGLVKAWAGTGDVERAIQILSARIALYENNEQLDALLWELRAQIGIYPTVTIGNREFEHDTTAIILEDVELTEADKQAIAGFTDLVTLSLINCNLTNVEFLKDCNTLLSLTLSGNPISDFTPLLEKSTLRTLYINDTAITDYSQLHGFTELTTLNIRGNWIREADWLALVQAIPETSCYASNEHIIKTLTVGGVTFDSDVTELDLSGLGLTDLSPLKACSALQRLDISDNKISYVSALEDMDTLTWLDLSGNRISNIGAAEHLKRLTYLDISDNSVTDLSPLAGLTGLTELYVSGNPTYHGHDALTGMTNLKTLHIADAVFWDKYLPLLPMGNLKELDLRSNKNLTEAAVTDFVEKNANCKILNDFVPVEEVISTPEPTPAATPAATPEATPEPSPEATPVPSPEA